MRRVSPLDTRVTETRQRFVSHSQPALTHCQTPTIAAIQLAGSLVIA